MRLYKEMSGIKGGNSGKKKKTGRIDELKYMDVDDVMESDMDENEPVGTVDNDAFVGQKKREGILMRESVLMVMKRQMLLRMIVQQFEKIGNKRNKSGTLKGGILDEMNGENRVKKKTKAEKVEGRKSKEDRLIGLEKSGREKGRKTGSIMEKTSERTAKVKDETKERFLNRMINLDAEFA